MFKSIYCFLLVISAKDNRFE